MHKIKFRAFDGTDADYQIVADVHNVSHGHRYPVTADEMKLYDAALDKKFLNFRSIFQSDDKDIGYVAVFQEAFSYHPHKYYCDIKALEGYATPEIFGQAWDFIQEHLRSLGATYACAVANEYESFFRQFLQDIGFQQVMRYAASELHLADFDFAKFAPIIEKVQASGIELLSVEELKSRDADWMHTVWALEAQVVKDVPSPEETQDLPFDTFKKFVEEEPRWDMAQMFVAFDGEQAVGLTRALLPFRGTKRFQTGLTGVLSSHRRRGIALALKALSLQAVAAAGGEEIAAENEENNPMYQINLQLGFKPIPSWLDFERPLTEA